MLAAVVKSSTAPSEQCISIARARCANVEQMKRSKLMIRGHDDMSKGLFIFALLAVFFLTWIFTG